jgi:hypothetical protein
MSLSGSMGRTPEPSRFTQGDPVGPQPPKYPHPHPRKPRCHPLRKLTRWLGRKKDS